MARLKYKTREVDIVTVEFNGNNQQELIEFADGALISTAEGYLTTPKGELVNVGDCLFYDLNDVLNKMTKDKLETLFEIIPEKTLTFSQAMEEVKNGYKVARKCRLNKQFYVQQATDVDGSQLKPQALQGLQGTYHIYGHIDCLNIEENTIHVNYQFAKEELFATDYVVVE